MITSEWHESERKVCSSFLGRDCVPLSRPTMLVQPSISQLVRSYQFQPAFMLLGLAGPQKSVSFSMLND
jgi:hypothetical protein